MKQSCILVFMFLVMSYNHVSLGQSNLYSTISKNINSKASSLHHALNTAGDTLFLKSIYQLNKVEVIGDFGIKTLHVESNIKEAKIPLNTLDVGEYTISVLHTEGTDDFHIYRKTIVFKVARLLPISNAKTQHAEPYLIAIKTSKNNIKHQAVTSISGVEELKKSLTITSENQPTGTDNFTTLKLKKPTIKLSNRPSNPKTQNILLNQDLEATIFVPYSLSDPRRLSSDPRYVIQSRAEYRSLNLRPNGKPYD